VHFCFLQPPEIWDRSTRKNYRSSTFGTWLSSFCFRKTSTVAGIRRLLRSHQITTGTYHWLCVLLHIQHATNAREVKFRKIWDTSGTVNTRTDHISTINKADTTATGKITVHIPTHVPHRLQDKTGMAGMADGDNRHYGCQDNLSGKIHRYNGWHQYSFLLILLYTDTTVIEITLTLSRIVALPTIRYDLWSLTVHGALWMLELNIRPNSFSSMNSFVRF